jgi:putative nucleotidyltransferase with HDIG domain
MKDISELFTNLEFLPPSPSILPRLLPLLYDLNANFDDVVSLIELDPALTAKLLQICNSAFFGNSNPVEDVRSAVSQIGYQSIALLAGMIDGAEAFQPLEVPGLNSKVLWKHSVTSAFAAKAVAETALVETGMIFTAGLMHDIGKVVLSRAYAKDYGLLLLRAAQSNTPPFQAEMAAYGYNHTEVGARLIEMWKLPPSLTAAVRFHHQPAAAPDDMRRFAACVGLGNRLAHIQERPVEIENPDIAVNLAILGLNSAHTEHWEQELAKCRKIIDAMTRRA